MKYTITSLSQKLIVSLDIEEGLYNERILEFDQPSVVLQNDIVEILESGESLISIPFHHFGLIDGEVPTDIEDAFYKLQEFINTLDVAGLVGIDTSFYISTYSPTKTVAYDATKPNFEIHLTGNLDLTITGTANGDSGIVNLYFTGAEVATLNGFGSLEITGAGEMIPVYFIHDSDGLKWYKDETGDATVDTSLFALKQGTILHHTTPTAYTGTLTNVGNVCTVAFVNDEHIGMKVVKFNGESATIVSRNGFTEFTTDVPFATNSTSVFTTFARSFEVKNDGTIHIVDKGNFNKISIYADSSIVLGDRLTQNTSSNMVATGGWYFGELFINAADSTFTLPSYANIGWKNGNAFDLKLKRYAAGVIQVLNEADGLGDLLVRNVISNSNIYANDTAADADANLPSGAFYKITGSRAIYQKP